MGLMSGGRTSSESEGANYKALSTPSTYPRIIPSGFFIVVQAATSMNRLFGAKQTGPKPTLNSAISNVHRPGRPPTLIPNISIRQTPTSNH